MIIGFYDLLLLFKIINLPIDSALAIVHLYRSTIASRYNLILDDYDDEQFFSSSSSSAKWNQENKTGHENSYITKGN